MTRRSSQSPGNGLAAAVSGWAKMKTSLGREGEQRKMDFGEIEGRNEVDGPTPPRAAGEGRKKKKTTEEGVRVCRVMLYGEEE